MTNTPNPSNESELNVSEQQQVEIKQSQERRRRLLLSLGAVLLVVLGGGLSYGWFFIQQKLVPIIEKNLAKAFNRPIELGQIEYFSPTKLRFGLTKVPATSTDTDKVSIAAVDVGFDPLLLLSRKTLKLNLTLIRPSVYLEQDENLGWVATRLSEEKGDITIELQSLKFKHATVVLVPREKNGNSPKSSGGEVRFWK